MWVYAESSGNFRNPGFFFHLQEINIECFHLSSVQNVFKLPVRCVVQVFRQNYHTNILSLNMFLCSFQFILQEVLSRNWLCILTAKLHKRHESLMFLVSVHDFAFFIKGSKYLCKACWINSQSARLLAKNTQRWEATAASLSRGKGQQKQITSSCILTYRTLGVILPCFGLCWFHRRNAASAFFFIIFLTFFLLEYSCFTMLLTSSF